ncbi:MAG: transcription factor FapR [Peptococcaceae bacterium]|jgi:acyl-coenzyme A thioesterase PaaI-like protein|nr:transcription factor FapR [Peptococcaceae bacterium]
MAKLTKTERRQALHRALAENPFLTDEELADRFSVSIPTIRLDRGVLGIPELRERTKAVAHSVYPNLRTLGDEELIGQLTDLVVGQYACSELQITEDMVLEKARVARGHHLFAQANSLASALVNDDIALTGSAQLRFMRLVRQDERVEMQGRVQLRQGNQYEIAISGWVQGQQVFQGQWKMFGFQRRKET